MCADKAIEQYSYDGYCYWEGKWELIAGAPMTMTPSPVIKHQAIAAKMLNELMNSIGDCDKSLVLFEEDWKISQDTVIKPDVVLICDEPNDKYIKKAPEIIVEIISKTLPSGMRSLSSKYTKEKKFCFISSSTQTIVRQSFTSWKIINTQSKVNFPKKPIVLMVQRVRRK